MELKGYHIRQVSKELGHLHVLALPRCFGGTTYSVDAVHASLVKRWANHGVNLKDDGQCIKKDETTSKKVSLQLIQEFLPETRDAGSIDKISSDCYMILIKEKDLDLYARAKFHADQWGYQTLFVVSSKLIKGGAKQVMSNLALKANMKFGGDSHWFKDIDSILHRSRHEEEHNHFRRGY